MLLDWRDRAGLGCDREPDIAGYTVLRGDAPGDTLRPLTPSPIRETTFRDTTVRPGARYNYAIVAVDGRATPARRPRASREPPDEAVFRIEHKRVKERGGRVGELTIP